MDFFRFRLPDKDKDEAEDGEALSDPSAGDRACSLRKARNSAGAISGWRLAGTQKRWSGSSDGLLGASVPALLSLALPLPLEAPRSDDELACAKTPPAL
jgi:hypothetical protein